MVEVSEQDRDDITVLWNYHVADSGEVTADLMIALGSHDLRVADRAAELFNAGAAPLVIVSGGAGKITSTKWSRSEAELYSQRMIELGVDAGRIVLERNSTNTGDNFAFSKKVATALGLEVQSGIIVCKPYMAKRALAAAAKRWPEVTWFARPPKIDLWDYPTPDTPLDRMINLMVGDLQRLDVYAINGFQVPVEIPPPVWAAYHRLVDRGFDQYVIPEAPHGR